MGTVERCCFKEFLKAAPHKTLPVQPLASHLTNQDEEDCWRSRDEVISDIHLWTRTHRHTSVGQPAKDCADNGCSIEDLAREMVDRDGLRERVKGIRPMSSTKILVYLLCM